MKAAAFEHARPDSVAEAIALLAGQTDARVLAGGQSLGPMLNLRLAQPRLLVQVNHLRELTGVAEDSDAITIGACVTHSAVSDRLVPDIGNDVLSRVAEHIAHRPVRNCGTIGGSLCHADPAADWVTVLMALDSAVLLQGPDGTRSLRVFDFILGAFRNALRAGEILTAIRVPRLSRHAGWGYAKACRKPGDFAHAMAAVLLDGERQRVVFGALGRKPLLLEGAAATPDAAESALQAIEGMDAVSRRIQMTMLRRAFIEAEEA
jgi:aerobic carbon-monoxide dehydrogenase medium subunit